MSLLDFKPEVWTKSSNEALKISLVGENAVQFTPTFTYPIYGDSEQIFGFKDLLIHLAFDSITLKPFLNVKYSAKIDEGDDVEGKLLKFLPETDVVVKDEGKWIDQFEKEQKVYQLPDIKYKLSEYKIGSDEFIVFKTPIVDDYTKKMHRRIQIFSLLFIEAASYIDENDPNWEIVWCFNKNTKQCVGYVTTYKYWKYKGGKDFDHSDEVLYRGKISQFIILPPYQGKGHGSYIYKSIFDKWSKDNSVVEVTVEDPNESFDDLRDRNDLEMLHSSGFFETIPDEYPINEEWMNKMQNKYKLEKRQFQRIVEMIMLNQNLKGFGLQVKKRLFIKNYDALVEMKDSDRKDALQNSFLSLKEDYERIISVCNFSKRRITSINDFTQNLKKQKN